MRASQRILALDALHGNSIACSQSPPSEMQRNTSPAPPLDRGMATMQMMLCCVRWTM
jgi:hypothetical protein